MSINVQWVGDFAVIQTFCDTETDNPIEFCRQQLIDWHGIDPLEHGFTPEMESNHV